MGALKTYATLDEQIELLQARGLVISDIPYARDILSRINYYRLINAYGLGLHTDDHFDEDVSLETIYRLYLFDIELRKELFSQLELIEVELRTAVTRSLSEQHGPFSYLDERIYKRSEYYHTFLVYFSNLIKKERGTNLIVKHHIEKYGGNIPIWAAVELFTFGTLSKMYTNLNANDQKKIAAPWNTTAHYLESWIPSLVEIRNLCAHHGRIYNRPLNKKPTHYPENRMYSDHRLFSRLIVMCRMMHSGQARDLFIQHIAVLAEEYADCIRKRWLGFPEDWEGVLHRQFRC